MAARGQHRTHTRASLMASHGAGTPPAAPPVALPFAGGAPVPPGMPTPIGGAPAPIPPGPHIGARAPLRGPAGGPGY